MSDGASNEVEVNITYLAMDARPEFDRPSMPMGQKAALIRAESIPPWWFLTLYRLVGADYDWTDWLSRPEAELEAFVSAPEVQLYTLMIDGWPGGFFMLDTRDDGLCDLAYFGLVPDAQGRGLGSYLLKTAIHMGWDIPGVAQLTVNTCTLDHPQALGLYQKLGFVPQRREAYMRVVESRQ